MHQGHSIMMVKGSKGGGGIKYQCASARLYPPGVPCHCSYSQRIGKVQKGGDSHFVIKHQDADSNSRHSATCTSIPKALQPCLLKLPEIQAKVANGDHVSSKDMGTARSTAKCSMVGQSDDSSARMDRRVAQVARSTSGKGSQNLWGRLRSWLDQVKALNPGCRIRVEYAPAEEGQPETVVYIFIMFEGALLHIMGEGKIAMKVRVPPLWCAVVTICV